MTGMKRYGPNQCIISRVFKTMLKYMLTLSINNYKICTLATPLFITQCWNGKDAGRYTNSIVNDGLQYQEYNPEVPIDLSRNPGDAQINQQIRALRSITQKIENAHRGLDVEWPVEGQHGNGKHTLFQVSNKRK